MTLNNKPTGALCPKCGAPLVVKESRRRVRNGPEEITEFIGCPNYFVTGCRHTEPMTSEIRAKIENTVVEVYEIPI